MIYSLRGTLIHSDGETAVIECAGVGYECRASAQTLASIGKIGDQVAVYTYLHVREDGIELFGFADLLEKSCFIQLISVSGVGPKAAIAILSAVPAQQFALLVASGDSDSFTRVKGIGAKTAQRIVLELKDKITKQRLPSGSKSSSALPSSEASNISDALSALIMLGYNQSEVMPIVAKADPTLPTQEIVKLVLKTLTLR